MFLFLALSLFSRLFSTNKSAPNSDPASILYLNPLLPFQMHYQPADDTLVCGSSSHVCCCCCCCSLFFLLLVLVPLFLR